METKIVSRIPYLNPVLHPSLVSSTVVCKIVWVVEEVEEESGFGRDAKRIRKSGGKSGWWEIMCGRRNGEERRVRIREWEGRRDGGLRRRGIEGCFWGEKEDGAS